MRGLQMLHPNWLENFGRLVAAVERDLDEEI
jgi:hypothetical protein